MTEDELSLPDVEPPEDADRKFRITDEGKIEWTEDNSQEFDNLDF